MMTDRDLQMSLDRVNKRARKLLQLVPFVAPYEEKTVDILSKDPELQGYDTSPVIFTDISPGANDRNRLITVREPNGLLRRAVREERMRMNQIYFPDENRFHVMPPMFEDEHLQPILDRKDYLFVLDKACVQFEPDDADFHRVTGKVFDHINENKEYDVLRSNRYFGSFVFYHVIGDNMDGLLQHYIEKEKTFDAAILVQLYYSIHNEKQDDFRRLPDDQMKQIRVSNCANTHHDKLSLITDVCCYSFTYNRTRNCDPFWNAVSRLWKRSSSSRMILVEWHRQIPKSSSGSSSSTSSNSSGT